MEDSIKKSKEILPLLFGIPASLLNGESLANPKPRSQVVWKNPTKKYHIQSKRRRLMAKQSRKINRRKKK